MPPSNKKRNRSALLLIDVINGFDFEGSRGIVKAATRAAPKIDALTARARKRGVPVIYVNDNFGRWRSDFKAIIAACTAEGQPGRQIAARLHPDPGDYFVLKPQHSGFYGTPLELLLRHLEVGTVVLAGFATNLCVAFTADDAHMRGYHVVVPSDCTASNTADLTRATLRQIKVGLHGDVVPSARIDFGRTRSTRA